MQKILLFVFACIALNGSAQINLVDNAGFEDTLGCPNQINQVNKANGWVSNLGSPDYFHSCANGLNPYFGVPVNARGYQQAHGGDAYVGLFTFARFIPNGREFVGRQLSAPLVVGQQYFVSFWVNHCDTSQSAFATDNMGAKFTMAQHLWFSNPDSVNNMPQIFTTTILTDTANWVKVAGTFIADSAYQFIELGNFFDDASTDTVRIVQHPNTNYAYYLIDDVCVSTDSTLCLQGDPQNIFNYQQQQVHLYPNPANGGIVTVEARNELLQLELFNATGRIIMRTQANGFSHLLNIRNIASGLYYLKSETKKGIGYNKVVIQKN